MESHQLILRAPIRAAAEHSARMHVQRGRQRLHAVPDAFELPAPCPAQLRRAVGVPCDDGLDARLLIDAQHHRALGRLAVQLADGVDLLPRLRVRAVQPLPNAVRADIASLPDALQVAATDVLHDASLHSHARAVRPASLWPGLALGPARRPAPAAAAAAPSLRALPQRGTGLPLHPTRAPGARRVNQAAMGRCEALSFQARSPVRRLDARLSALP